MKLRYLPLLAIMFLGSYPVIELTRVILVDGRHYYPELLGWFIFEIAGMWLPYLAIVPIYLFFTRPSFGLKRKKVGGGDVKGEMS